MFRFTIRDMLWLMLVVALAVGWGLDRRALTMARTNMLTLTIIVEAQQTMIEDIKKANREHVSLLQSQKASSDEK